MKKGFIHAFGGTSELKSVRSARPHGFIEYK